MPPFRLLILGDGNFSFSLALCRILYPRSSDPAITPTNAHIAHTFLSLPFKSFPSANIEITTTSFDTREQLYNKYHDSREILVALEERYSDHVKILHGINAWELQKHFGVGAGFDAVEDFRLHRFLLSHFFNSVLSVLAPSGSVQVSLVQGQETRWDMIPLAARAGLNLRQIMSFDESYWPGYVVKRNKHGGSFKNMHTKKHVGTEMKSHVFSFWRKEARVMWEGLDQSIISRGDEVVEESDSVNITNGLQSLNISNTHFDQPNTTSIPTTASTRPAPSSISDTSSPTPSPLLKPKPTKQPSTKTRIPVPADLTCPHCQKVFTTPRGYRQHVHMVHTLQQFGPTWTPNRPKTLPCLIPSCPKHFASEPDRWQHRINKHTTVGEDELPISSSGGTEFLGRDTEGKEYDYYPCEVCGQAVVRREWGMELHLETLKPALGLDMRCPGCPGTFIEQRALFQHYKFCRLKRAAVGVGGGGVELGDRGVEVEVASG
ncbi:hypothetical protein HDV00_001519 [Rhizophlyctis rosea]|nr:hypothetical protein HDV00_001519 [Rhizophlyctis rosea]